MNRFYNILFAILLFTSVAFSQNAPDFTVTDTHGNTHTLYADYLDQGKTVVLDLMFVNCPPCNDLAPLLQPVYADWGSGQGDVQFISLTSDPGDTDQDMIGFEQLHGTTFPGVSAEGGGPAAQEPFTTGTFGPFYGYPTLVVVSPDGSVQFDAWGSDLNETIQILDSWIVNTGAEKFTSDVTDVAQNISLELFPNPAIDRSFLNVSLESASQCEVELFNILGERVTVLHNDKMSAGNHEIQIDVQELPKGSYVVSVKTNQGQQSLQLEVL